ncbi:MAG: DNA primase [Clostridia bacterium]|nr:DNA primase [Clostridia bacterium]
MRGFDAKFLDELKAKSNIIDIVGKYVHLEQRGGNFWGRCPFHHEKTASFCVNSIDQFYYCFGCHKGGDVINFVQEIESLDFYDAVKLLAENARMELPQTSASDEKIKQQKQKKSTVLAILKDSARYYASNLRAGNCEKHEEYINKRAITAEVLNTFGIGASSGYNGLVDYLKQKGYTYSDMVESGAVSEKNGKYFDALAGRLIIPVIDQFNNVVAFCGRIIDDRKDVGKYVNTRETIVFSKGKTLFNLNNLKKVKNEEGINSVIVVEGHMDAISLYSAGVKNVVASMGTALTKDQARIIKRFTNDVYISYDGDFAGRQASIRGLEILRDEGLEVKVVSMPDGLDPDDVIKKSGVDAYRDLIKKAKLLIDFKLDVLKHTFDLNTSDGKRKFIKEAIKVISESDSASEREDLLKSLRDETGITYESLKRELDGINTQTETPRVVISDETLKDKITSAEQFVLYAFLFNKEYAREEDLNAIDFPSKTGRFLQKFIIDEHNKGEQVKPNLVFDLAEDDMQEDIKEIFKLEISQNAKLNEEKYFSDCIKALKVETIDKKIAYLTKMYREEKDLSLRRGIASELSALVAKKSGLK